MEKKKDGLLYRDGVSLVLPFIAITTCFALWGFANDVTNPMVKAFSKIFRMSVTDGSLVQMAFYGGYFCMAFPAALFIQRFSFKAGVLMGLSLYTVGALAFIPARFTGMYYPFLLAYFVMTCGLSFLETSCNPYIYCMGSEQTATRRLNLAQSFNPIGSLMGMFVAMQFVQSRMSPMDSATRARLPEAEFEALKMQDLGVLIQPYVYIGIVLVVMIVLIAMLKMPSSGDAKAPKRLGVALRELLHTRSYREGVVAQFFYVGAQITCWTFIIQYGTRIFMQQGMGEKAAEVLSQQYNIVAMVFFACSRFICTWFLKYVSPSRLLAVLAIAAIVAVCGVIGFTDERGMYCLVAVSACMSLMFPTIYGISLKGLADNVKFGAAGLIMSILGGSVLPPVQAMIIDADRGLFALPAVNISFVVPLVCFVVIALFALRTRQGQQVGE